jgi:hypothetical protein
MIHLTQIPRIMPLFGRADERVARFGRGCRTGVPV